MTIPNPSKLRDWLSKKKERKKTTMETAVSFFAQSKPHPVWHQHILLMK